MDLNQVTLLSQDVARATAFYVQLGLRLIVRDLPNYVRFETPTGNATLSLHYGEGRDVDGTQTAPGGVILYFECDDLDATVDKLRALGLRFETPPVDQPWLWRESTLRDPDGREIRLYSAGNNRKNPPWRITTAG